VAERRLTEGVVSRDLHEVAVEDPETRPDSGTTDAVDANAVPIELPFKPLMRSSLADWDLMERRAVSTPNN
jgi:hypothetical protein